MQKPTSARRRVSRRRAARERLDSWKEIAAYLKRDVRTVHRWEHEEGLPVHRHRHKQRHTVYAYREELDAWLEKRLARPRRRKMLAVLPFTMLGAEAGEEYLGDGLTEEMITELARLQPEGLGVIARTSVMQYKQSPKDLAQIGEELSVDYVLEGSVRRSGARVRVTAQLIRVRDQSHIWADSFDRVLSDVLEVQAEVAGAIAEKVGLHLTPGERSELSRSHKVHPEAFEAFLKGRFHWYKLSREHLDTALGYFRLAREKDPDYARAYVGIAYVWLSRADCGLLPTAEAMPQAKSAALRAIELDDSLAEAHEVLANIRRHYEWDWPGAEAEFRRAIELNAGSADAHFMYSDFLISLGRAEEAQAEIERALELDPFNFFYHCFAGWHALYRCHTDEAVMRLRRVLRREPNFPAAHLGLWGAFHRMRDFRQGLAEARQFFTLLGDSELAGLLACGDAEADYRAAMRQAAERLEQQAMLTHVPALRIARLYAHAGANSRALDWLETAYREHEPPLVHLAVGWDWDALRAEERFQELLRRMNFLPEPPGSSSRAAPAADAPRA